MIAPDLWARAFVKLELNRFGILHCQEVYKVEYK